MAVLKWWLAVIVTAGGLSWACFSPRQPGCAFSCVGDGRCPTGYTCESDGLCHRDDGTGACDLPPQTADATADGDASGDAGSD
jgi:hypothetical protein